MSESLPWSMRGIDPATREAAKEAARRAGLSLGEWLEQVIASQPVPAAAASQGGSRRRAAAQPSADVHQRLRQIAARDGERTSTRSAARDTREDEVETLVAHAAALEARTREAEAQTTSALESIANWIEKAEQRMAASERSAADRQERATSIIADAIKSIGQRVAEVERRAETGTAPEPRPVAPRRPFSRETVASAVADIRERQRDLDRQARRDPPAQERTAPERAAPERAFRAESAPPPPPQQPPYRDVTPLLEGMQAEIAQLRQEIKLDMATMRRQQDPQALEDSIRDLARRLDSQRSSGVAEELARPLARIESEVARLSEGGMSLPLHRIEAEIARLSDQVDELSQRPQETPALASALRDLGDLRTLMQQSVKPAHLDPLGERIADMASELARLREQTLQEGPLSSIVEAIDDIRQSLDREARRSDVDEVLLHRIARQVDDVTEAVHRLATGGGESARAELVELSRKLDHLASRTAPESDALASRIEAIVNRLEMATSFDFDGISERIGRISEQLDSLAARRDDQGHLHVAAALERQFEALQARLDSIASKPPPPPPPPPAPVNLQPIEKLISDLGRKLEEAQRPDADGPSLAALERQIAALSQRLEDRPVTSTSEAAVDRTLRDMIRFLGKLRDETTSAVEQATRAAVGDMLARRPESDADPGIERLRADLAGLRDVHSSIEERTASAIGQVNVTLETIVDRLAALEHEVTRPPVAAPMLAVEPPAARAPVEEAPAPRRRDPLEDKLREVERAARRPIEPPAEPAPEPVAERAPPAQARTAGPLDALLEPGSGRPTEPVARPRDLDAVSSVKASYIAAARRAAQAAASEAAAPDAKTAGKVRAPKLSAARDPARPAEAGEAGLAAGLKEALEKRKKPILLGLAALVLALGAGHVATTLFDDGASKTVISPAAPPVTSSAPASDAAGPGEAAATGSLGRQPAPEPAEPASPRPEAPAPGDSSLLAPPAQAPAQISPAPPAEGERSAALAPAAAAPEPINPIPGIEKLVGPKLGTPGLRIAALKGDPNAVHELAVRAADGAGMARDPKLARELFESAARTGHAPSQFRLGNIYEKGIGTPRDIKAAADWYRRAAEAGNARAQHNLAVLLAEGIDGRADFAQAAGMFRKAAEAGIRDSQYNLAILLGRGLGTEQDLAGSYMWFAIAAQQGDDDAARRRDDVEARLSNEDLARAKGLVSRFKPQPVSPAANEVTAPPEGWDPQPRAVRPPPARSRST